MDEYTPDAVAVEDLYFGENARSAFAVGQARGVVILAAGQRGVRCSSYTPQQVKAAVCGSGRAAKDQVQRMVQTLLMLPELPKPDHAADALAVAICHANGAPMAAALQAAVVVIALVSGEVAVRRADHVVVACGGVGYRLNVSAETLRHVPRVGEPASLHTHLIVRDDALLLYGFATEEERDLFLLLIGVQSVGPKMALAVLSGGPPRELLGAVAAGDTARLQAVPGIGKRTAERIVVELREKVGVPDAEDPIVITRGDDPRSLAREALLGLGYTPVEADALLRDAAGRHARGPDRRRAARGPPVSPEPIRTPGVFAVDPAEDAAADRARAPGRRPRGHAAPAAAGGVRRPGGAARAARASRSPPPPSAARRSTTCCWPARPAWARPRWRRSSPPSSTSPFVQTAGPALERKADIAAFLTALEPRSVFFVDEIHRLPRAVEETFYPAMEDRQLPITVGAGAGARVVTLDLPPFTLVGATTRSGLLTTPLRDRFGIQHRLDHYAPGRPRPDRGALARACWRSRSSRPARARSPSAPAAPRASPTGCSSACATSRRSAAAASSTPRRPARALDLLEVDHEGLDRLDREILGVDLPPVRRRARSGSPRSRWPSRRSGHDRGRLRALPAPARLPPAHPARALRDAARVPPPRPAPAREPPPQLFG